MPDTSSADVVRDIHDGVAVIRIDVPSTRNALTAQVMLAIADHLTAVDADDAIRAAVITGAGSQFASGGDIRELRATRPSVFLTGARIDAWDRIIAFSKPLVAAVRGVALGGGCELALTCDAIIAGDDARLGLPEVSLGLIPGAGGGQRLARAAGRFVAAEVVLGGRRLTAWEARRLGLVAAVVPREQVVASGADHARALSAGPPLAARFAKRSLRLSEGLPIERAIDEERALTAALLSTEDMQEATSAFLEKREPRFTGR